MANPNSNANATAAPNSITSTPHPSRYNHSPVATPHHDLLLHSPSHTHPTRHPPSTTPTPSLAATSPGEVSMSPGSVDRVFPIRSVIEPALSHHTTSTTPYSPPPPTLASSTPGDDGYIYVSPPASATSSTPKLPSKTSTETQQGIQILIDERNAQALLDSATHGKLADGNHPPIGFYATNRHKHVETEEGHMVITGVTGSERLQHCEDEPIRIPGAVQGFGCLVAFRMLEREGGGDEVLDVRIVSENTANIIGYTPHDLFSRGDLSTILSHEQLDNLLDHIDFIKGGEGPEKEGPEVFQLIVTGPNAVHIKLWCSLHIPPGNPDLVIAEFELEDDSKFPLNNGPDDGYEPEEDMPVVDTLHATPTEKELVASTRGGSKPLRKLRQSRRRRGEDILEVYNLLSQIQEQLTSAENLEDLLAVVVGIVKELTGFHRIMMYQFDESFNGAVTAEIVDPRVTCDLYMGLHFPASDIPAQARELYKINKVRLLYNRTLETARLICRTSSDLSAPLDLTHAALRAMSPIHIKYLAHMHVRASMSISVTAFGQLWGLISCHSYGKHGMRVPFPIRKMCRLVGENASRNIERLSYTRRLYARLINVNTEQNPGGYFVANSDDLLSLFDADCGLLSIRDETKVMGDIEDSQESLALLEYLRMKNFGAVTSSRDLAVDFPDLKYPAGFSSIAGLLLVPLSSSGDFIVFFRKPQLKKVHWAGNPYEKTLREGTSAYLEPRKSFALWSETVIGKSQEWTEEQIETAAVLCLVYGKFIAVWRQKEAALKSSQLTRLLLANASHEVRTPLNAIINYLEIALEGPLDTGTRENLIRSHSASKSLIYVINDLLDLTRPEAGGRALIQEEEFELRTAIGDAVEMFRVDAKRKGLRFEVVEYPGLPGRVKGDPKRLGKAVANVVANAVKYTDAGGVKVEVWATPIGAEAFDEETGAGGGMRRAEVEIAVQDTGCGMSPEQVDTLFKELEQTEDDRDLERDADIDDPASTSSASTTTTSTAPIKLDTISSNAGQKMLGLGLAVVARVVRVLNGQLKVNSALGAGSRFTISVPLPVCETPLAPPPPLSTQPHRPTSRDGPGGSGSLPFLYPGRILRGRASTGNLSLARKRADSMDSNDSAIDRLLTEFTERAPPDPTSPHQAPPFGGTPFPTTSPNSGRSLAGGVIGGGYIIPSISPDGSPGPGGGWVPGLSPTGHGKSGTSGKRVDGEGVVVGYEGPVGWPGMKDPKTGMTRSPPLTRPPVARRQSRGVTKTYTPAYEKRSYFGEAVVVGGRREAALAGGEARTPGATMGRGGVKSDEGPRGQGHVTPQLRKVLEAQQRSGFQPTLSLGGGVGGKSGLAERRAAAAAAAAAGMGGGLGISLQSTGPENSKPKPPEPTAVPPTDGPPTTLSPIPTGLTPVTETPITPPSVLPPAAEEGKRQMRVLVAEDDPINSKIIKKRLEKMGYFVQCEVNGLLALEAWKAVNGGPGGGVGEGRGQRWDAILMDMQMPIMDGATSTSRIRAIESSLPPLSPITNTNPASPRTSSSAPRIPIFAVSASLLETNMPEYLRLGFDGWMLKPIDFKRLGIMLEGIWEGDKRWDTRWVKGGWEGGGWFTGT